jgi:BlaI family transcriptional regulator, penicillinase repressor
MARPRIRRSKLTENEPSPRELDVLKALWALGSGSVREVHRRMCPDGELAFNTVQTLLRIMDEKGLVRHRAEGRTFVYEPAYSRDRVASRLLHRVFDGALEQVVLSLLQAKDTSEEELRGLERLIATARRQKGSRGEGKKGGD